MTTTYREGVFGLELLLDGRVAASVESSRGFTYVLFFDEDTANKLSDIAAFEDFFDFFASWDSFMRNTLESGDVDKHVAEQIQKYFTWREASAPHRVPALDAYSLANNGWSVHTTLMLSVLGTYAITTNPVPDELSRIMNEQLARQLERETSTWVQVLRHGMRIRLEEEYNDRVVEAYDKAMHAFWNGNDIRLRILALANVSGVNVDVVVEQPVDALVTVTFFATPTSVHTAPIRYVFTESFVDAEPGDDDDRPLDDPERLEEERELDEAHRAERAQAEAQERAARQERIRLNQHKLYVPALWDQWRDAGFAREQEAHASDCNPDYFTLGPISRADVRRLRALRLADGTCVRTSQLLQMDEANTLYLHPLLRTPLTLREQQTVFLAYAIHTNGKIPITHQGDGAWPLPFDVFDVISRWRRPERSNKRARG